MSRPAKILVPSGIGDIYWVAAKLEDFVEKELDGVTPDLYVWNWDDRLRGGNFADMLTCVNYKGYYSDRNQGPEFNKFWFTGEKCIERGFRGFDYFLCFNGVLRQGGTVESCLPHMETNWYPALKETSFTAKSFANNVKQSQGSYILSSVSDIGMYQHWLKHLPLELIVSTLQNIYLDTGRRIVLTGSEWDASFHSKIEELWGGDGLTNLTGETTLEEFMELVKGADAYVGWCGGNSIVSVMLKCPTVMLWCDYFPTRNFAYNCQDPASVNKWYHPLWVEDESSKSITGVVHEAIRRGKSE